MASLRSILALLLFVGLQATVAAAAVQEATAPSPDDERIAERLRSIFDRVDELSDVEVSVTAGVVELRGLTSSADARRKAEELASGLEGVVYVSNELRETTDVARRLTPSLEKVFERVRGLLAALPLLLVALVVFFLFALLARLVEPADWLFSRVTRNRLLQGILKQVVRTVVLVCGLFVALEILGATALVGAVLGTAGVVGIAIGFAFRDIVENYLATILLSARRPFRSKDLVEIDGRLGTVIRMTTRDTVLMTPEGNHLSLPNAVVFKSSVLNYTRNPLRRFRVGVGIGNEVDPCRAIELGLDVLKRMAGIAKGPAPFAEIEELAAYSVNLRFYAWVDQRETDFSKARSEAVRLLKAVMDEHGIDLPVPIQEVHLRRQSAAPERATGVRALEAAAKVDVAPERHIEEQVDRDLELSGEEDLLEGGEGAPRPSSRA